MWGNSIKDHKQFNSFNCVCDMTYNNAGAKSASIFYSRATFYNTFAFCFIFQNSKHKKQTNTAFYIHLCSYWVCVYHINMFSLVQYYLNKVTAKKINNGLLKSTQTCDYSVFNRRLIPEYLLKTIKQTNKKTKNLKTKIKWHSCYRG